jgi:hypothetical protein
VWIIPTNEELVVARQTRDLLAQERTKQQTQERTGG